MQPPTTSHQQPAAVGVGALLAGRNAEEAPAQNVPEIVLTKRRCLVDDAGAAVVGDVLVRDDAERRVLLAL